MTLQHLFRIVLSTACLAAQTPPASAPASANQGAAIRVDLPQIVRDNVGVQAVLLPYTVTSELFGKHIAQNYVAIFVNVSNRSRSASLIIQGLYIDYSRWALSGTSPRSADIEVDLEPYSTASKPNQVSSVEYRIVRGQLEERQPKSARNWTLRGLQLAGSVAAAYTFPLGDHGIDVARGIAAFNGVGIPGFEKLWPDSFVAKLNRVSDWGYRVNRVVPRESAEIVVAFFPIDRFLTAGLKKLFMQSPAVFYNPGLALIDDHDPGATEVKKIMARSLGTDETGADKTSGKDFSSQIKAMMACHSTGKGPVAEAEQAKGCKESIDLRRFVRAASLSSIAIVIDGSMVIDLASLPPVVNDVKFETGQDAAAYWTNIGAKQLTITGRYLADAEVVIEAPAGLGPFTVTVDRTKSNDELMKASFPVAKPIPAGTNFTIRLKKTTKDNRAVESSPTPYTVSYIVGSSTLDTPTIASKKITITGKNLFNANLNLALNRTKPGQLVIVHKDFDSVTADGTKIEATFKELPGGCYFAIANINGAAAVSPEFGAPLDPTPIKATRGGNVVTVTGKDLASVSGCGAAQTVEFKVVEVVAAGAPAATPVAVTATADLSGKTATFPFSGDAAKHWSVQVGLSGGTTKSIPIN